MSPSERPIFIQVTRPAVATALNPSIRVGVGVNFAHALTDCGTGSVRGVTRTGGEAQTSATGIDSGKQMLKMKVAPAMSMKTLESMPKSTELLAENVRVMRKIGSK